MSSVTILSLVAMLCIGGFAQLDTGHSAKNYIIQRKWSTGWQPVSIVQRPWNSNDVWSRGDLFPKTFMWQRKPIQRNEWIESNKNKLKSEITRHVERPQRPVYTAPLIPNNAQNANDEPNTQFPGSKKSSNSNRWAGGNDQNKDNEFERQPAWEDKSRDSNRRGKENTRDEDKEITRKPVRDQNSRGSSRWVKSNTDDEDTEFNRHTSWEDKSRDSDRQMNGNTQDEDNDSNRQSVSGRKSSGSNRWANKSVRKDINPTNRQGSLDDTVNANDEQDDDNQRSGNGLSSKNTIRRRKPNEEMEGNGNDAEIEDADELGARRIKKTFGPKTTRIVQKKLLKAVPLPN